MFCYESLREGAQFPERLEAVFDTVGTSDFEMVMRRLNEAVALLRHYDETAPVLTRLRTDVRLVRSSLIHALTAYHPRDADYVEEADKEICANFLHDYDRVFTLTYDLLLYWVMAPRLFDKHRDGFGGDDLHWRQGEGDQTVFYVHGGLHLFRVEDETFKRSYAQGRITDQLREALDAGDIPLFVSEGESRQKLNAIRQSPYLNYCYEALRANDLPLCIYGFAFDENDDHIARAIERSRVPEITIFLHSGGDPQERDQVKERGYRLRRRLQAQGRTVPVRFRESNEVRIWPE